MVRTDRETHLDYNLVIAINMDDPPYMARVDGTLVRNLDDIVRQDVMENLWSTFGKFNISFTAGQI